MLLALLIVCFASNGFSLSVLSPCKLSDTVCVEKSINAAIPTIIAGDPELGVDSSDPLFVDKIVANVPSLQATFYNTTHTGFKTCTVSNLMVDEQLTKLKYDLNCQKLNLEGQYETKGNLVVIPVEGSGDYSMFTGKYLVNVESDLKQVQGDDGKTHLVIKNFKLKCTALEPMGFDFKNLFNGDKKLSDAVHKFAHENWKAVSELVQDPVWYACMKKMISNVNKYMKNIALEDIVLK